MIDSNTKIILLIRSYNRPHYLKKTLDSLLDSDIDLCYKRYIYDDGSDKETINILENNNYINLKNKEFIVIKDKNTGVKQSYLNALNFIKNTHKDIINYYICTLDNDLIVKNNFISVLYKEYNNGFNLFKHNNILLTGYNTKTHAISKNMPRYNFCRKITCGGINYFFKSQFLDFIIYGWEYDLDWGVCRKMRKCGYPLLCLKKSVINHIGTEGLNSTKETYSYDSDF